MEEQQVSSAPPDSVVNVLSLEYQTLRSELLTRAAFRYQMLTIAPATVAIAASLAGRGTVPAWVIGVLVFVALLASTAAWWDAGRIIGRLSTQIAYIEKKIN